MISTPAKALKPDDKAKTSGGISKKLLTPCRRVGLSRVVKTPASSEKGTKTVNSPLLCGMPVAAHSPLSPGLKSTNKSKEKHTVLEVKPDKPIVASSKRKSKKSVKKCLLPETQPKEESTKELDADDHVISPELFPGGSTVEVEYLPDGPEKRKKGNVTDEDSPDFKGFEVKAQKKKTDVTNVKSKSHKSSNSLTLPVDITVNASKDIKKGSDSSNKVLCDRNNASVSNEHKIVKQEFASSTRNDASDMDDDDFQPCSKRKKIRRLSNSSDSSVNSVHKVEEKIVLKKPPPTNGNNTYKNSFKKRLSMKKSKGSDNDSIKCDSENEFCSSPLASQKSVQEMTSCVVNLTELPLLYEETHTQVPESSPDRNDFCWEINGEIIKEIEDRVGAKEVKLASLKRAEVYLKKHRVDELNALTEMWKSGCVEALKDLLTLLKSHGEMDMVTLLRTLNVPENMISYNPENCDLF